MHVSEGLGGELDSLLNFSFDGDVYDLFGRLREAAPVLRHGDRIVVTRFDEVATVLRDADTFLSAAQGFRPDCSRLARFDALLDGLSDIDRAGLLEIVTYERPTAVRNSGSEHRRLRFAVQRAFTVQRVAALRGSIQQITDELLDELVDGADVIGDFAYRLPLYVVLDIMGVPRSDERLIREWAGQIGANRGGVVADAIEPARDAYRQFLAYIDDVIDQLRRSGGRGLLADLIDPSQEARLREDELAANMANLLFAGHETSAHLIGNGLEAMWTQRVPWEFLCRDPTLAARASDEAMRFDPPVQYLTRIADESSRIGDTEVEPGAEILLLIGAANRDWREFDDPDRFDLERDARRQLGFGLGAHRCLGAFLATTEAEIAFASVSRRFPMIRRSTPVAQWRANRRLRGLERQIVQLRGDSREMSCR